MISNVSESALESCHSDTSIHNETCIPVVGHGGEAKSIKCYSISYYSKTSTVF